VKVVVAGRVESSVVAGVCALAPAAIRTHAIASFRERTEIAIKLYLPRSQQLINK
jgi:hypothetical protein